jgi:hypothetical protein
MPDLAGHQITHAGHVLWFAGRCRTFLVHIRSVPDAWHVQQDIAGADFRQQNITENQQLVVIRLSATIVIPAVASVMGGS